MTNPLNHFVFIVALVFLFTTSGCSFIIGKDTDDKIKIEKLKPIMEENKIDCDSKNLQQLEITKCEMEARLLEIQY